jgi:malate dehydrogenase (oxaloacetate-decarboxylating)(NADP+)
VQALADLTLAPPSDVVAAAYGGAAPTFGPDYIIPRPFDPRLILEIAPAVAKAAMESGVATRPIKDFDAYRERLTRFVFRSGLTMKPVFEHARTEPKRVVYAEGEDERVLRAVQQVIDDRLAKPIIIGRRAVVERRIERLNLRLKLGQDVELCDPEDDQRYQEYWGLYHEIMERKGVAPDFARRLVRTQPTAIAALMVRRGEADAMLCGTIGQYRRHLHHVIDILGLVPGASAPAALSVLILPKGTYFLCDTEVVEDPSTEQIAEMTLRASDAVRRFGIVPKVALVSHSNFGSTDDPSARKMRDALVLIRARAPQLEVEGEMHADVAIDETIRRRIFPNSRLKGSANLLIMPTLDAANIAFNALKALGDGIAIGPVLLGSAKPAHIVTPSVTVRGLLNMTAIAVYDAQVSEGVARGI